MWTKDELEEVLRARRNRTEFALRLAWAALALSVIAIAVVIAAVVT